MGILFYFFASFSIYLLLTAGSGEVFYFWAVNELVLGGFVSLILALITYRIVPAYVMPQLVNPLKWLGLIFYCIGPFFFSLLIANLEVLYRIVTGKINPAIVEVETGLESEVGLYLLANSITLSPGTLTVDIDAKRRVLYVHCLNWHKQASEKALPRDVTVFIYRWVKRIYG